MAPTPGIAQPLWPDGAPGYDTAEERHDPTIAPYPAPGDGPRGAVVVLPGGGYARRAPHEGEPIARWLNTLGIHGFVAEYRCAPYRHPWPLRDAQRALRWVRHHADVYRVDPEKVAILGFSAGGHLASTAGTHFTDTDAPVDAIDREDPRPSAMVLCYPVISFTRFAHLGSCGNLLGPDHTEAQRESLSNELHVSADTPPTFLWHTADDAGVPVENSLMFASALSAHKVPFGLHVYPHGRHGLGLAPEDPTVAQWTDECGQWLLDLGY